MILKLGSSTVGWADMALWMKDQANNYSSGKTEQIH